MGDERICTSVPVLDKSIVTALSAVGSDRCNSSPSPSTKFGNGSASLYVTVGHDVSGFPSIAMPALSRIVRGAAG